MDIDRNLRQATVDVDNFIRNQTFTIDPDEPVSRVPAPTASRQDFKGYFGQWKNFKVLFGTAYSWFALDIAFYGLNLNTSPHMLEAIKFSPECVHALAAFRIDRSLK